MTTEIWRPAPAFGGIVRTVLADDGVTVIERQYFDMTAETVPGFLCEHPQAAHLFAPEFRPPQP